MPLWAKRAVDEWTTVAGINGGAISCRVSRLDKIWGDGITSKTIWHVVKAIPKRADIRIWPLMTCVAPVLGYAVRQAGNLSKFRFLLGHPSVQTTERYLGCRQKLSQAVNDNLALGDHKIMLATLATAACGDDCQQLLVRNALAPGVLSLLWRRARSASEDVWQR